MGHGAGTGEALTVSSPVHICLLLGPALSAGLLIVYLYTSPPHSVRPQARDMTSLECCDYMPEANFSFAPEATSSCLTLDFKDDNACCVAY